MKRLFIILLLISNSAMAQYQIEYALVPQQMQPAQPTRNVDLNSFKFPCEAVSACLVPFYAEWIDYPAYVNVKLVWTCMDTRNKLEIIAAASGPSNFQRMALFECDGSQSPIVLDANITLEFQWWVVAQGGYRQVGYRVLANPDFSPRIQEITLDVVYF